MTHDAPTWHNLSSAEARYMATFLPLDWYYPGNLLRTAEDINLVTALGVTFSSAVATAALLARRTSRTTMLAGNALATASAAAMLWLLYSLKG